MTFRICKNCILGWTRTTSGLSLCDFNCMQLKLQREGGGKSRWGMKFFCLFDFFVLLRRQKTQL